MSILVSKQGWKTDFHLFNEFIHLNFSSLFHRIDHLMEPTMELVADSFIERILWRMRNFMNHDNESAIHLIELEA